MFEKYFMKHENKDTFHSKINLIRKKKQKKSE